MAGRMSGRWLRPARVHVPEAWISLAAVLFAASSLAAVGAGCETFQEIGPTSCSRSADDNPPVRYAEGIISQGTTYQTSEFDGELLYFPGGMRYELEHGLGARPDRWEAYLSFDRFGARTGTVALAAGNQVELIEVTDETITVANGSCVEYWLLVVASVTPPPDEEPDEE